MRGVFGGAGDGNDSSERRWWCDSKVCAEDAADCSGLPSRVRKLFLNWSLLSFLFVYCFLYYFCLGIKSSFSVILLSLWDRVTSKTLVYILFLSLFFSPLACFVIL